MIYDIHITQMEKGEIRMYPGLPVECMTYALLTHY